MLRLVICALVSTLTLAADSPDAWLQWNAARAESIGKSFYVRGRVGSAWDMRVLKTERAYNYKLAATWITADAAHAAARLIQLAERLSDDATRALAAQATIADHATVMVEIDPREGSGVIPNEWVALLAPVTNGAAGAPVRGVNTPALREARAAAGVLRRNYDYDRFWMVFPLTRDDGTRLFPAGTTEAELIVRIHDQEGTVRWKLPE